ncbi:MAG: NrdJb, partial [Candidatus Contendobacter sp.]|nr:NrdJb [Candidatus Contendobacter sp.]
MAIKIDKKIVAYSVVKPAGVLPVIENPAPAVQQMHESLERPDVLPGATYKVKTPLSDHALYITINDVVLNPGTEHEIRRPFEIFINSKAMEHFQW